MSQEEILTYPTLQLTTFAGRPRWMWRATDSEGHVMGWYPDKDTARRVMRSPEAGEWKGRRP